MKITKKLLILFLTGLVMITIFSLIKNHYSQEDILERNIYEMTDEEYEEYCDVYYEKYGIPAGDRIEEFIDYDEKLKDIPSDIEGMSQYDKKEMGLFISDGSDTDGDGLTDKEEIEVYNSNPLKSSTAGDLYYDSYKVEHGMDLHTYYEYEEEFLIPNNQCSDIVLLNPIAPESSLASVYRTHFIVPENFEVYEEFEIIGYSGTISFDLVVMDLLDTDIDVLVMDYSDDRLHFCDFTIEDNRLYLQYDFLSKKIYDVIVGASNNALSIYKKVFDQEIEYSRDYSGTAGDASYEVSY